MHSAIVRVEAPTDEQKWLAFEASIAIAKSSAATIPLADHVWLIDVQKSPAVFARFVDSCERHGLAYRILAIDVEPRWLPAGFDPEAK